MYNNRLLDLCEQSFSAITGHFIDHNFKMRSILLSCDLMCESHTAVNLAEKLRETECNWGVEYKIILAVSDNANNIKSAITNELGWKFFGCFAHTLNLTVQDALSLETDVIQKVKTIVSHFKRSTKANTKLQDFQKQYGVDQPRKLIQDVVTRWNSTYHMLARFIELENPIRSVLGLLDERLPRLTSEEWVFLKELCEVLRHFEDATNCVSGENYISASLVIILQRGLLNICEKLKASRIS